MDIRVSWPLGPSLGWFHFRLRATEMQQSITQLFCLLVFFESPKRLDLILQTFSKFNCSLFTVAQYNSLEARNRQKSPLACCIPGSWNAGVPQVCEEHRISHSGNIGFLEPPRHNTLPSYTPWDGSSVLTHRTKRKDREWKTPVLRSKMIPHTWIVALSVFREATKTLKGQMTS